MAFHNETPYFAIIVGILLFLSIICSVFLIVTFAIFGEGGKVRTYPIKLIMYLCTSLVIAFLFFLLSGMPVIVLNPGACFFSALMVHYSFMANFCWTFCIAFNFYRMIVAQDRDTRSYEKWYHLASWGTPAVLVIIVGSLQHYGRLTTAFFCYIDHPNAVLIAFFVPGLLIVSANTILFVFVAREIRETLKGAADIRGGDKKDLRRQLRVYISIVFSIGLSWIFGFLSLLFSAPETVVVQAIFDILFNIFTPLQGFFLFGSYCLNEKIFKKWAHFMGRMCGCCLTMEEKLDAIASGSTGTTTSRNSRASRTASSKKSSGSKSTGSDVEISSGDSRF